MHQVPSESDMRLAQERQDVFRERQRRAFGSLESQTTGVLTAAAGIFLTVIAMYICNRLGMTRFGTAACLTMGTGYFSLPAGAFIGWLSHRIFIDTTIPVAWVTMAGSLIVTFSIVGWALVLTAAH